MVCSDKVARCDPQRLGVATYSHDAVLGSQQQLGPERQGQQVSATHGGEMTHLWPSVVRATGYWINTAVQASRSPLAFIFCELWLLYASFS